MKYSFLSIMLISVTSYTCLIAQDNTNRTKIKERVQLEKVAYITEKLDLSEAEAQKFWPIYNGYRAEMQELKKASAIEIKEGISEDQADVLLQTFINHKEKETQIQKKFIGNLKNAIPSYKILQLLKLERTFKEKIVKKVRSRRE